MTRQQSGMVLRTDQVVGEDLSGKEWDELESRDSGLSDLVS